jgi:2-amino-4-hydroxy-6-hydroxymethyldihydropteridine diphosphokinase
VARAFLGLGSNMGDRCRQLQAAIAQLPDLVAVSALYETQPLGGPPGQSPYLNMVVELDTDLSPRQLLELGQSLEAGAGRVRGARWSSRPLDVDVLLVDGQVVDSDDLVVPHPRMWERRFVLVPLSDLVPELVPPGLAERAVGEVRRLGRLST